MLLVVKEVFLSPGRRGDGNSDGQRKLQLLCGAATPSIRLSGGEGAEGQQTDPGAGAEPGGRLQGEEQGGREDDNDERQNKGRATKK